MILAPTVKHEKWFDVPGAKGAKVLIREIGDSHRANLLKTLAAFGDITTLKGRSEYLCQIRRDSIADWKGIEDEEGSSLPLTEENKALFLEHEGIEAFIEECAAKVGKEATEKRAEAKKNS